MRCREYNSGLGQRPVSDRWLFFEICTRRICVEGYISNETHTRIQTSLCMVAVALFAADNSGEDGRYTYRKGLPDRNGWRYGCCPACRPARAGKLSDLPFQPFLFHRIRRGRTTRNIFRIVASVHPFIRFGVSFSRFSLSVAGTAFAEFASRLIFLPAWNLFSVFGLLPL